MELEILSAAQALDLTLSTRAIEDHMIIIALGIKNSAKNGSRLFNYFYTADIDPQIYNQLLGLPAGKGISDRGG